MTATPPPEQPGPTVQPAASVHPGPPEVNRFGSTTVVAESRRLVALVWIGFPLLGAAVGWALQAGSIWLAGQPWVPKRRVFEFVADLPELPRTAVGTAVGLLVGLVIAGIAADERLMVRVTPELTVLVRGDKPGSRVDRAAVDVVFYDRKHLVLLDRSTAELAHEKHDLSADSLRAAFLAHGYPWRDGDPHEEEYRLWVKGAAALPPGADVLLEAREKALRRHKDDDARELRREVSRLGLVLRDRAHRQYWRRVTGHDGHGNDGG
jgi:hypothetical protein